MSTRSSARNLFSPLDNPELTIRKRSRVDPTILNDFDMATKGYGDPPVPDLRTMEELCQPSLNGRGGPIAPIAIQATNFGLKNDMIQQLRNEITYFYQCPDESLFEAWERYKLLIDQCGTFMKRRPEEYYDLIKNMTAHHNDWYTSAQWSESSSSITSSSDPEIIALKAKMAEINKNLMKVLQINHQVKAVTPNCETYGGPHSYNDYLATDLKGITTRSGTAYQGPTIPTTSFSFPQVVERETEVTKDTVPPTNNESTKDIQPPVVQTKTPIPNSEPIVTPVAKPVAAPISASKPNQKPSIPYPSRLHDQKLRDKANDQKEKFFQIFKDFDFNISFADALILMPKFGPTIKSLLTNKDKFPGRSQRKHKSHAIISLEQAFPSQTYSHFDDCRTIVDFDADPRVPLILKRSFLKTKKALIDVYEGELTLRVGKEAITFNLDQTSRYSANYNDMTRTESTSLIWLKLDAFLALEDDPTSREVDHSYFDTEGDILLLEAFLNDDPSLPPPNQGMYLPQVRKELKIYEAKNDKSSIDEPPKVELKDLPPHLEYAFLEGDDNLPVIIAKDLSVEEKVALIKVLKSHKQSIAWKLSDIKGINPEFCTHKILMEDDLEPAVQHQRRVHPKIHDVIKKEGGFTVVENEENELFPTRLVTGWRVCIDYRKLNEATHKDHFLLPLMDQMLERLTGNEYYCFLDGFSVFMDDFLVFGNSFGTCLSQLKKMLQCCEDTNLYLNCEKSHFMVKEGIVLGHKISKNVIEVDMAKVDVITKLPHPTTVKGIRSFLGHAGFYRRFIQDFSKLARPMTHLFEKDTPFFFSNECIEAFQTLKKKLTKAPILVAPDWDLPFKLMCDASDFAIVCEIFDVWGIDFMGPFPSSRRNKYILVAINYLSKWVEVKALPNNDARVVCKLLKSLFARFGTPRAIISDRSMHFSNDQFTKVMLKYGGTHRLATAYYPQTSRQVEVSNSGLKRILERTVGENHAFWSEKLDNALWAFRTTFKTPIRCTPYKLVYGKACHLPIELEHKAYWALKHENFDLQTAGDHRKV
nr:reverse transcriptase domain-containing protein [Tanacetum cinerariifolium]